MLFGLVTRSNHEGISKTNTVPQPAESKVTDRNPKGHPQNKVNQKELPQLKRNISVPSLKLRQNSEQNT